MTLARESIERVGPIRRESATLPASVSLKPYFLLLPALVFLFLFTYFPLVEVVWDSLYERRLGEFEGRFVGLENYARLFADDRFRGAVLNNLLYALGTILPSLFLALLFALALKRSTRVNNALRSLFFFPTLVPLVAASALFIFILLPGIGLLDYYLAKLGFRSVNWLGDPDIALWSLVAITVWKNAGYFMLFFLAGLQGIPADVEEAALIEGANGLQRLWYVTLPLLMPTIAFVAVIALIAAITQVDHVIVMTKGAPNNATNLVLFYIYQNAHEFWDHGKATAATVVSLAALLALSLISLRSLERGIHYEAD